MQCERIIWLRAMQGLVLSFGSPLGWLLIRFFSGVDMHDEFTYHSGEYIYMAVGTAIVFTAFGAYTGFQEHKLAALNLIDPLTGLYNHRYFSQRFEELYASGRRNKTPVSLIMIDLDYFKRINDTYGHFTGDKVLQAISDALIKSSRTNETVSRVGGEEICVLLENCPLEAAVKVADRLREVISQVLVTSEKGDEVTVTASAGVASSEEVTGDMWEIYSMADEAMYRAKDAGRNCTRT